MSKPVKPPRAKLFIGILFSEESILLSSVEKLQKKFGSIDYQSNYIPFSHTSYYNTIGKELYKVFYSFNKLIKREEIVNIKIFSNSLEDKFSVNGERQLNIDPGYITLSNVFLATCKEYFHRVYLTRGVYLENEYRYVGKKYIPWEWTYPDYQKSEYIFFFQEVRRLYHKQLQTD